MLYNYDYASFLAIVRIFENNVSDFTLNLKEMVTDIVRDYKNLSSNIHKLIEASGYKLSYITDKMGIDRTSFYYRRKNNKFSIEEIENLLSIIRADELEDRILGEMSIEGENSETLSRVETEKILWS